MWPFSFPTTALGVALAAALAWGGVQTVRLATEQATHVSEVAEIRQAQQSAIDEAQMRANQAALRYEEWKASQRPKIVTVIKEVDRALQTDSRWAAEPLPVSVRDALNAARTLDATPKPEPTMPTVGSGDADNER